MKKYIIIFALLCVAGLILAPVLCMPLYANSNTGTYTVDVGRPVAASVISFSLAAVAAFFVLRELGQTYARKLNPWLICGGIVAFGPFYALAVAYKDAANTLSGFMGNWGFMSDTDLLSMPGYIEGFNTTSTTYLILTIAALGLTGFGVYRTYKCIKS